MRKWELLTSKLDPQGTSPLFLQLSNAVAEDIRQGRLKPGDVLPGTRALAESIGVHRNTIIAGYKELKAQGLVCTRTGGGTFVVEGPRRVVPAPSAPSRRQMPTYSVLPPLSPRPMQPPDPPGKLIMVRASPDVRLLPAQALARAYRRALLRHGRKLLAYGDPRGHLRLRSELATMLSHTRGLATGPDDLIITRGAQHGLDLLARALFEPGDVVAVEALGYWGVWSVLRLAGAELVPVPVDEEGLDMDALEALLRRRRLRAVVVTPSHQFPTNVVMSPRRRARLAALALEHRLIVIEDDYDHEFHYEGKPLPPLAAGPGRANVTYVGSLSKVLAPGLRTGFIMAPPPVLERLASLRTVTDVQGDTTVECAIAELFEEGEFLRHVRRMRNTYARRRDALAQALGQHLPGVLSFRIPDGGAALWAKVDEGIDIPAWCLAGEELGVVFRPGQMFDFEGRPHPYLRLGFTYHNESELAEAARLMAKALGMAKALALQ